MSPVTQGPVAQEPAATLALARLTAAPVPVGARSRAAAAMSAVASAAAIGASDPALAPLTEVAASLGTPPAVPVPGTTGRYAATWAAYLTGTAAVLGTGAQPDPAGFTRSASAPVPGSVPASGPAPAALPTPGADTYAFAVVPAALAVGAGQGLRSEAVAEAVAVGLDVARRIDAALGEGLGAFDRIATIGHLAAVTAASRLLGLDEEAAAHAYGIAATQSAGFAALAGTPAGALQTGKASADAVESAYLARTGYTAGPTGIEGRRGFAALLAPTADIAALDLDPSVPDAAGAPDATTDLARTAEDFITAHACPSTS